MWNKISNSGMVFQNSAHWSTVHRYDNDDDIEGCAPMMAKMMIIIMIYKTWVGNLFQSVHLSRFSRRHTEPTTAELSRQSKFWGGSASARRFSPQDLDWDALCGR